MIGYTLPFNLSDLKITVTVHPRPSGKYMTELHVIITDSLQMAVGLVEPYSDCQCLSEAAHL